MRSFKEKVANEKMGAKYTAPIVAVFEQKLKETLKWLAKGGRASALWMQYYYMVDVINIFIRPKRLADYNGPILLPGC